MTDYFDTVRAILAVRKITASAKLVLIHLFDKQGGNGHSWPSISTIQEACGLARSTVVAGLAELTKAGFIEVTKPTKPSVRESNRYSVNLELVRNSNQSMPSTGMKIEPEPVRNPDQLEGNQSEIQTRTGTESGPELVRKSDPNVSVNDSVNDSNKKYGDFVRLTGSEHAKLVARFGEEGTRERIDRLDNYIGSKGKRYKSHYYTILSWEARNSSRAPKSQSFGRNQYDRNFSNQTSAYGRTIKVG